MHAEGDPLPVIHSTPDADLLLMGADGDAAAFSVLYDRHQRVASQVALRICRHRETAEDVLQQAFLEVWRHARRFDPARGSVGGWIMAVVQCRAIDAVRRQHVRGSQHEHLGRQDEAADDDVGTAVGDQAEAATLRRALLRLPRHQQAVLLLNYRAGLSHTEIAAVLDIPLGTVKGRARLALATLRQTPEVGRLETTVE